MWYCVCNRHICNMITTGNDTWQLLNVMGFVLACIHSWRRYKFQLAISETQSKTMIFLVLISYIPLVLTVEVPGHRTEAFFCGTYSPTPEVKHLTLFSSVPGSHVLVLHHMSRWAVDGSSFPGFLGRDCVFVIFKSPVPCTVAEIQLWMDTFLLKRTVLNLKCTIFPFQTDHFWVPESYFPTEICQSVNRYQNGTCLNDTVFPIRERINGTLFQ